MRRKLQEHFGRLRRDPLYRGSFVLVLNSALLAIVGFAFWVINSRLFTPEEIGLGSTLVSMLSLFLAFTNLGFMVSVLRYLPTSDRKQETISTAIVLTCGLTFLMAAGYLIVADWVTPELAFLNDSIFTIVGFLLFAPGSMLFALSESIFIAERRAKMILAKNILNSVVKLALPFVFAFGAFAILSSWGVSLLVSALFVFLVLGVRVALRIDWSIVRQHFTFGMANYFANLILMLPFFGLPVYITHVLSPEDTAYFYIPWMISVALFLIPQSVGKVLLAEGAYESKAGLLKKSFLFNYVIVIPAIAILLLLGRYILSIFGAAYVTYSWPILPLLLLSSLLFSVPAIMSMYYNIENKTRNVILINVVLAAGTFGFASLLLSQGLLGIALGWTFANVLAILLLPFLGK